ncbi:MAG: hypothetical protein KTR25_06250 [Myxococcales bacterium]|nr:hypothetical protein [Myxococcales bacterium]
MVERKRERTTKLKIVPGKLLFGGLGLSLFFFSAGETHSAPGLLLQAQFSAFTPVSKRTPAQIHFEVTPSSVVIYLDGRKLGPADKVSTVRSRPGRRTIRLVRGKDETELQINVRRSETLNFRYDFGD